MLIKMPNCAMKFCKYSLNKNDKGSEITYHKFPTDLFWKDKWIELVRKCRTEDNWLPSETTFICSSHFADIDWYITSRRHTRVQRINLKDIASMNAEDVPSTSADESLLNRVKSEEKQMDSLPQTVDLAKFGTKDPVKTEPITIDDAPTNTTTNGYIDNKEAEDVNLPAEERLVDRLQCQVECDFEDFTAVKNEIIPIITNSLNSDAEDIPLSMIKIEQEILSDDNENSTEASISSVKIELPRLCDIPIVYTTRLDDMRVFNNLHCNIDEKNIFIDIINESKPKFRSYPNDRSRTYYESEMSFKNLVEKLNKLNMKSRQIYKPTYKAPVNSLNLIDDSVYLNERNRNLLKLCKPLSILLVDLKNKHSKIVSKENNTCNSHSKIAKNKPLRTDMFNIDNILSSWRRMHQNTKNIYIMLSNTKTKTLDIFLLDGYGTMRLYYRNTVIKEDLSQNCLENQISHKLCSNFCCWYKRKELIESFCASIDVHMSPFVKSQHDCVGLHCTCCCKPVSIDRGDDESVLFIDDKPKLQPKDIVKSLYTPYNKYESLLIDTALRYRPTTPAQRTKKNIDQQAKTAELYAHNVKIRLKNERTTENEYYELGPNGEVVSHIKNQKLDEIPCLPQTSIKTLIYCCWFKRENILKNLPSLKISPNALIFMKIQHGCLLGNCCCCCKLTSDKYLRRRPVLKINIPMSPIHTINNNKTSLVNINFFEKPPVPKIISEPVTETDTCHIVDLTATNTSDPNININHSKSIITDQTSHVSLVDLTDTNTSDPNININHSKSIITDQTSHVSLVDLTATNTSDPNININNSKSIISDQTSHVSPLNSNSSDSNKAESTMDFSELGIKQITGSIIEKFRNVSLGINNEGKLIATISKGDEELSNTDFKMLGQILSLAQKEIDDLNATSRANIVKLNNSASVKILKDNIYAEFASLHYANRNHSLTAYVQIKKEMSASRKSSNTIDTSFVDKHSNKTSFKPSDKSSNTINTPIVEKRSNKTSFKRSNKRSNTINTPLVAKRSNKTSFKRSDNAGIAVASQKNEIVNKTQSSDKLSFVPIRPLVKPKPVDVSNIPLTANVQNKNNDKKVAVFTHKTMKRNRTIADQTANKRPRVEKSTQSNDLDNVNNQPMTNEAVTYEPIFFALLPTNAQFSNQSSHLYPNVASASDSQTSNVSNNLILSPFTPFHVASSPTQIPLVNLVSDNINTPSLQPINVESPQTVPTLAVLPLPAYPLSSEIVEAQNDDSILGI